MADVVDAIVIGSGPNGLAAAIVLARAGRKVIVFEAAPTLGGGLRSLPLTLPDFVHDVCSAIHPFAVVSPVFRTLPLSTHGLEWIEPPAMFAHPFDDGTASVVYRSIDRTAAVLGRDGAAYRRLIGPTAANWGRLEDSVLGPLRVPRHPFALARFGLQALRSAEGVARSAFATEGAQGLFAGVAAHSVLPLDRLDAPIPWRSHECTKAATVHLGGTLEEIARSALDAWNGVHTERPFTLLVQPTCRRERLSTSSWCLTRTGLGQRRRHSTFARP